MSADTNTQTPQTITTRLKDHVLVLTLNRPDKLNAFTTRMCHEMITVFDDASANKDVRAIVVTGAGRAFCAGADLERGGDTFDYHKRDASSAGEPIRDGGGLLSLAIARCTKPVIAAVNGPAVGVGITMQLPMDIRIASDDARFGFVFSRRGIAMEACSSYYLPKLVGPQRALEWCYTGRIFGAHEAKESGLVLEIASRENLMKRALEIAGQIAQNCAPVSVSLMRHMIYEGMRSDPMTAHRVETAAIRTRGQSDDVREGVQSFLEKRPPKFPMTVPEGLPDFFPWTKLPQYTPIEDDINHSEDKGGE